jgi:endonuclease/exonuclease/phosphatase family metal-dependent hydrolase
MDKKRIYSTMKLIQVNAWLGRLLPALLNFIDEQQPDIICAQEIQSSLQPNPLIETVQTLEYIKKVGGFKEVFFSPTFSFKVLEEEVQLGNAIFSKYPITERDTIFTNSNYNSHQTVKSYKKNIRNLQLCKITFENSRQINIANHHGYHELNQLGNEKTKESIEKAATALVSVKDSLVFCADLNIVAESPNFEPLNRLALRNLTLENKVKTTLSPAHRIYSKEQIACDFILTSENIQNQSFEVSDSLVSDHKALILEFEV